MLAKQLVGLLWILGIMGVLVPSLPWAAYGLPLVLGLAGIHAVECLVFLPRLKRAGGSLGSHLLQTFLFGMAHVLTLPANGEPS